MKDVVILTNCRRFNIPTCIVRSKADQHVRNLTKDMGYDGDDDEDKSSVRSHKSNSSRRQETNMFDQKVYIVLNEIMLGVANEKQPKKAIDEFELLNTLSAEAYTNRTRHDTEGAVMKDKRSL